MIGNFSSEIIEIYKSFIGNFPPYIGTFISLFTMVLFVVIYAIFIWKFYRFIATKNILELNLNQYNKYNYPFLAKTAAGFFYLIEYIIILPFLIFFWFVVFTLFLIILSQHSLPNLLVISTIIIASIRMASYYKEDLSKELAKMLPFTLLAVSILNPNFFSLERITTQFTEIASFFSQIVYYLAFIIVLEIILRFFDFIFSLFGVEDEEVGGEE